MHELVHAEKANFPVQVLCEVLDVSRSGFYAWRTRTPSAREKSDVATRPRWRSPRRMREPEAIRKSRVYRALRKKGIRVGKKRIARLMPRKGSSLARSGAFGERPTRTTRTRSRRTSLPATSSQLAEPGLGGRRDVRRDR